MKATERYTCRLKDATITVIPRTWTSRTRESEFYAAPRLYVGVNDETILQNLINRRNRPYNIYKKMLRDSLVGEVFDLSKLSWSQYAGCSCPCSPGFIIPKQVVNLGGRTFQNFDVWVEFGDATPKIDPSKVIEEVRA